MRCAYDLHHIVVREGRFVQVSFKAEMKYEALGTWRLYGDEIFGHNGRNHRQEGLKRQSETSIRECMNVRSL